MSNVLRFPVRVGHIRSSSSYGLAAVCQRPLDVVLRVAADGETSDDGRHRTLELIGLAEELGGLRTGAGPPGSRRRAFTGRARSADGQ